MAGDSLKLVYNRTSTRPDQNERMFLKVYEHDVVATFSSSLSSFRFSGVCVVFRRMSGGGGMRWGM